MTERDRAATDAAGWALELVARPSVNGTADEAAFAPWLCRRLLASPAFTGDRGEVWAEPVPGDPLGRAVVAALARGRGPATVVLTGHYDTVRFDTYGELAPLALQPHELREAMLARPPRDDAGEPERRARADLAGGAFLPGRGLLDMKAGLAAALAAIGRFAADPARTGNLLFLAVPDEEAGSAGARAAAAALPGIAARLGLSLEAAINLDALVDAGDGEAGRCVALGTVGKLLPSALVVGRAAHAAEALRGLNAAALMAGIVAAVEWSPALAETSDGEAAAPPTLLGLKDGRASYDVTTPDRIWAYWNVMTLRRPPAEVLGAFATLCREGAADGLRRLAARAAPGSLPEDVPVLTFAELRRELDGRPAAAARLEHLAEEVAGRGLDLPEQCRRITDTLWTASGRSGPAVVVGFASLPYLPSELKGAAGERLRAAVERARSRVAARHATTIGRLPYFPGISDVSFFGQVDASGLPAIAASMPAWKHGVAWPDGPAAADLPTVNAGPWGRDYHTPLERLHAPYAFEVLPDLVHEIAREVLAG